MELLDGEREAPRQLGLNMGCLASLSPHPPHYTDYIVWKGRAKRVTPWSPQAARSFQAHRITVAGAG